MNTNTFPTKGNLIAAKSSLALARQGYGLMDRKRNILIRELMGLIDQAKDIQREIDTTFTSAYDALMQATIELGLDFIKDVSGSVAVDNGIRIKTRSVMGTEIPLVQYEQQPLDLVYAYYTTRESLDIARERFLKVKELTVRLSMIENAAYRLASNIKKTQKRANALKNITIPRYEALSKSISDYLEEKEREEFTRLKVIKERGEK
jgi:V-type ATPase, D subunit